MTDIMEARRKGFEEWAMQKGWRVTRRNDPASTDEYMAYETQQRWECWNAALDSVCVELPQKLEIPDRKTFLSFEVEKGFNAALDIAKIAIELAGLKVKP